jgi:hypothetical protein
MAAAGLDCMELGLCKDVEDGPAKSLSLGEKYRAADTPVLV